MTTIGLLFAAREGVAGAAAFAAMALAGKRLAVLVLAPFAGRAGDRLGATQTLTASLWIAAAAFIMLSFGAMAAGVATLVAAAAFAATVLPLSGPDSDQREHLHDLARLNAARDLGAAIGPISGTALFTALGGAQIYALSAALLASMALGVRISKSNDRWWVAINTGPKSSHSSSRQAARSSGPRTRFQTGTQSRKLA